MIAINIDTKGKKGMSHVEMIISFTIFVGFVLFLIFVIKPFRTEQKSDVYLDILEREIQKKTEVEVNFTVIKINQAVPACFHFPSKLNPVIVKDEDEKIIEGFSDGNNIYAKGDEDFYYIYASSDFKTTTFNTAGCTGLTDYKLGLLRNFQMTSNKSLFALNQSYTDDYETLKEELRVPSQNEFAFYARDAEGNILLSARKEITPGVGVLARDIPIQIVYENGGFKYALLNIQIW